MYSSFLLPIVSVLHLSSSPLLMYLTYSLLWWFSPSYLSSPSLPPRSLNSLPMSPFPPSPFSSPPPFIHPLSSSSCMSLLYPPLQFPLCSCCSPLNPSPPFTSCFPPAFTASLPLVSILSHLLFSLSSVPFYSAYGVRYTTQFKPPLCVLLN